MGLVPDSVVQRSFSKTGCKNKNVDIIFPGWRTQKSTKLNIFDDMYSYCQNTNNPNSQASGLQKQICCGNDTKNCGPGLLKCQKQTTWSRMFSQLQKIYFFVCNNFVNSTGLNSDIDMACNRLSTNLHCHLHLHFHLHSFSGCHNAWWWRDSRYLRWWKGQTKSVVLNDMYAYCHLTNTGKAVPWQNSFCCGNNNIRTTCGKGKLNCRRQSDWQCMSV